MSRADRPRRAPPQLRSLRVSKGAELARRVFAALCSTPLPTWLLLTAVLAGAAMRVHGLGEHSLWNDELSTWYRLGPGPGSARFWNWIQRDVHPPGYLVLMSFWVDLFGDSEASLRAPSALAGVLLIPLVYGLARSVYGSLTGAVAAWLTAVSPFFLWYSQEARAYELVTLCVVASCWSLHRVMTRPLTPGFRLCAAAALPFVAGAYLHYAALIANGVLLACGVALCAAFARARLRCLLQLCVTALSLYLPWLQSLVRHLERGGVGFIPTPGFEELVSLPASVLPPFVYVLAALGAAAAQLPRAENHGAPSPAAARCGHWLVCGWFIGGSGLMWTISNLSSSLFNDRNLIVMMPPLVVIVAAAAAGGHPSIRRGVRVVAWLGVVVAMTAWQIYVIDDYTAQRTKQDIRGAVAAALKVAAKQDLPILAYAHGTHAIDYYLDRLGSPKRAVARAKSGRQLVEVMRSRRLERAIVVAAHIPVREGDRRHIARSFKIDKQIRKKGASVLVLTKKPGKRSGTKR